MQAVLRTVYNCLPPPAFPGSDLPCGLPPPAVAGINEQQPGRHTKPASAEDNTNATHDDRISFLPDNLRHEILARLPIRDAVRTAALSRRWRRHGWASAPLHLDDGHLLRIAGHDQRVQRLSRLLLSHPGPFRRVRLVFTPFGCHPAPLRLWVSLLAAKRVEDLVLVNRPPPVDMALPADIMRCTSLRRLHLGFFAFPTTAGAGGFGAELTELGLYCVVMASRDLSHVLRSSPKLEKLSIVASYGSTECVCINGHKKLRGVVVWSSVVDEIFVQDAEKLERLVLCGVGSRRDSGVSVRIDRAPSLRVLGYLEPGVHRLVIGDTVIQLGAKISVRTVVPSVRVLGLRVPFGDKRRSKLLPAFLRCFPNVDTLHIESTETNESNGKVNLAYWQKLCGDITCVDEHVKRILVHNFRGEGNELAFLKFLFGNASALEAMVIILSEECLAEIDNVWAKLSDLGSTKRASKNPHLLVTDNSSPPSFEMALDLSTRDPFCSIDDFINEQLQQQQVGLEAEDVEPTVILSSGRMMPVVGLGMSHMVGEMEQHAICDLMSTAIAMGYRHFDCTSDFDTEMKIGKALTEACQTQLVERKDLFITTQVPYKNPGNVIETCKRTLRNLQLDYVDLYLVSIPHSGVDDSDTVISLERTWNAMEELVSMGLVNSIGISNCDILLIRDLLAYAKINPAVSQIKLHPYLQRDPLVKFCQKHEMYVMVPNPDCDGLEPFLKDTVIKDLAKKYSKTPAQVVLRWGLQRSMVVISDISRVDVLNPSDLFDFNISAEDMEVIKSLDRT